MATKLKAAVKAYAVNPAVRRIQAENQNAARAQAQSNANATKLNAPTKGIVRPSVAAPPAAPAPAAAPPPPTPLPWDANYETSVGGINRNRDAALAQVTYDETQAKQAYGYDDLSSPFSKLALLKETLANAQRGDTNSLAAGGQLYSGSAGSVRNSTQHGYDVNQDSLRREYDSVLNGLTARRTQVTNDATDQTAAADWDRVQAGLANRTDPTTLPAPAAAAPAAVKPPANLAALKKAWNANKNHTVSWEDHARGMGWM